MEAVLIAVSEDQKRNRLANILGESYLLLTPGRAHEVFDALKYKPVDLLIIDDTFDDRSVFQLLPGILRIRESMPVIVITHSSDEAHINDCLRCGASEVVQIPLRKDSFLRKTQNLLKQSSLQNTVELLREARKEDKARLRAFQDFHEQTVRREMNRKPATGSLASFSKALVNIRDEEELFRLIVESLTEVLAATNKTTLVLREPSGDWLSMKYSLAFEEELLGQLRFRADQGIFPWLRRNGNVLVADRLEQDIPLEQLQAIEKEMRLLGAKLIVPLGTHKRLLGFLAFGGKITAEPFCDEELRTLFMFANCAAEAVENAAAYREIESREKDYERILQGISLGIVAADTDGNILAMNETAAGLLRLRPEEVTGKRVQKLGSIFSDILLRALKEKKAGRRQRIIHPVTKASLEAGVALLKTAEGRDAGAVLVLTEAAPTKEETTPAENILLNNLSDRLIDYIGNSLVPISLFTHEPEKKYRGKKLLEDIEKQVRLPADDLKRIIDILADRTDASEVFLQEQDLELFLSDLAERKKQEWEGVSINLKTNLAGARISFDKRKLGQAFENIFQNSMESFAKEQTDRKIDIIARSSETKEPGPAKAVHICIIDNGRGFDPQIKDKAFQPGYSFKKGSKHLGFGLYTARIIIESHGGSLSIETVKGKGTTVSIELPAQK